MSLEPTPDTDATALEAAIEIPRSMLKATRKWATSQEQVKLLSRCTKIRMGTRGVELLLARIINEDILACGEEIGGGTEVEDIRIYDAIMARKVKTAERKQRKWKTTF